MAYPSTKAPSLDSWDEGLSPSPGCCWFNPMIYWEYGHRTVMELCLRLGGNFFVS